MTVDPRVDAAGPAGADGLFEPALVGAATHLNASRCPACERVQFPARNRCPACSTATEPAPLAGPARLVFVTQVLADPPGSLVTAPYPVGVAEFPPGIRVIGLLTEPHLTPGDTVRPVVAEPADGLVTFAFGRTAESEVSPS